MVKKAAPLRGGHRGQRLHGLRLPLISIQIAQDRQETDPLSHAEQPHLVGAILLQLCLHAGQAEPVGGHMGELLSVALQREEGGRIPRRDISEHHLVVLFGSP